jgi:hypothetical protein
MARWTVALELVVVVALLAALVLLFAVYAPASSAAVVR